MAKQKGSRSPPSVVAASGPVPVPKQAPVVTKKGAVKRHDYASDGVKDHDIFWLPSSDYQVMIAVTVLAAVVRLFRIYQPSSVVFDEVQYVFFPTPRLAFADSLSL